MIKTAIRPSKPRLLTCGLLGCLLACAGCPSGEQLPPPGPPRPQPDVVEMIERNAARLQGALFAKHISVNAKVRDEKNRSHSYNLEGTLLYRKPRDLRIDLRPGIGQQVMGIGSNPAEYWIWIEPEVGTMHWGRHMHIGKPCATSAAVMPHQMASALGLGLPLADEGLSGPDLVQGPGYDVLQYSRFAGSGTMIAREYWVERAPPYMVRRIIFRDVSGQEAMTATLDDYAADYPNAPLAPHRIEVRWPGTDSRIRMSVSKYKPATSGQISPRAFTRPGRDELPDDVSTIIQVDEACD